MSSAVNSLLKVYLLPSNAPSAIPSLLVGTSNDSLSASQDDDNLHLHNVSATAPLVPRHYQIPDKGLTSLVTTFPNINSQSYHTSTATLTPVNVPGTVSGYLSEDTLYPAIENLPTGPSPLPPLSFDVHTFADDHPASASSYRLFLKSPIKWLKKSSNTRALPKEHYHAHSPNAILRDNMPMDIITNLGSPGLGYELGLENDKNQVQGDDDDDDEADNALRLQNKDLQLIEEAYSSYIQFTESVTGIDFNDIDLDIEIEDGTLKNQLNESLQNDNNHNVSNTVSKNVPINELENGDTSFSHDAHQDKRSFTLSRHSTLRLLTAKTKMMFKLWSPQVKESPPNADSVANLMREPRNIEDKENQDPVVSTLTPRRSRTFRERLGTLSLNLYRNKSNIVKAFKIEIPQDSQEAENVPLGVDSTTDNFANFLDDVGSVDDYEERLRNGYVVQRKCFRDQDEHFLDLDNNVNGHGLVQGVMSMHASPYESGSQQAADLITPSNILCDKTLPNNENYEGLVKSNTFSFSILRRRTIKRAESFKNAARAAAREFQKGIHSTS